MERTKKRCIAALGAVCHCLWCNMPIWAKIPRDDNPDGKWSGSPWRMSLNHDPQKPSLELTFSRKGIKPPSHILPGYYQHITIVISKARKSVETDKFLSHFFQSLFPSGVRLSQKWDVYPTLTKFKNKLFSRILPLAKTDIAIYDPIGLSYFIQSRVGLSHLHLHKSQHNFRGTLNPLCPTRYGIGDYENYLLLCLSCVVQVNDLQLPFVNIANHVVLSFISRLILRNFSFSPSSVQTSPTCIAVLKTDCGSQNFGFCGFALRFLRIM